MDDVREKMENVALERMARRGGVRMLLLRKRSVWCVKFLLVSIVGSYSGL